MEKTLLPQGVGVGPVTAEDRPHRMTQACGTRRTKEVGVQEENA